MALRKKEYSATALSDLSLAAIQQIEQLPAFRKASSFAVYHALPDEVQTAAFIERWADQKAIYLPVICGEDIQLHLYRKESALMPGAFGILEPIPEQREVNPTPDLMLIPGVAFDRELNRMGRGKGYYDRLLKEPELKDTLRIGVCFSFQLVDRVPVSTDDITMHMLVTDEAVIPAVPTNG